MDARHVVTELRARLGGLPTSDTRRMVEAFFAFAAQPASYEDSSTAPSHSAPASPAGAPARDA
jgi:hypothetical protein